MKHRVVLDIVDQQVQFAPPEYVIARKLEYFRDSGSDRHLRDIRSILRVHADRIDTSFIIAQVDRLGLHAEWEAAKSTKDR